MLQDFAGHKISRPFSPFKQASDMIETGWKKITKSLNPLGSVFQPFLVLFTSKVALHCHFSQGEGAAKFFSVLQGAVNQKRLKNTGLDDYIYAKIWEEHILFHLEI